MNGIERIALFVDLENFVGFCCKHGLVIDLEPEIEKLKELGKVTVRKSFGDIHKLPIAPDDKKAVRKMLQQNLIQHEDIPYQNEFKNSADIRLVIDALSLVYQNEHIDKIAVVASDRDYLPLFAKIREIGKEIIGIGGNYEATPTLIVKACDYFLYHENLVKNNKPAQIEQSAQPKYIDIKNDLDNQEEEIIQHEELSFEPSKAFELLCEAIKSLERYGVNEIVGVKVIHTMRNMQPDFDYVNYGFKSFKDLCYAAENKGLISINHNGIVFELSLNNDIVQKQELVIDLPYLRSWFYDKIKVDLPNNDERNEIYEKLLSPNIYEIELSLNELSKNIAGSIHSIKASKACYKILFSLYKSGCFDCIPGQTPYNPIILKLSNQYEDCNTLDYKLIENTIKVYNRENSVKIPSSIWSQFFFETDNNETLIDDIIKGLDR